MIFVSQLRWLMGDLFKLQTCHSNVAIHSFLSWSEMLKEFCLCFELLVEQQKPTECGKMGLVKKKKLKLDEWFLHCFSVSSRPCGRLRTWLIPPSPASRCFLASKEKKENKSRSSSSDTGENVITLLVRLPDLVRGCWLEWQLGLMTWRLMDDFYQTLR